MKATLNKNEIVEEIRRVNSEQGNPACLSWQVFKSKTRLAYSRTTILKSFDGKWTLACNAAGVTPCEAANPKNLISPPKYSKEQIREKLEQIAHKMPDGLTVRGLQKYGLSVVPMYRFWGRYRSLEKACEEFDLKISASSGLNKKLSLKYSKEQIREKLEQIAREMPDGLTGENVKKYGLSRDAIYHFWGRTRGLEKACKEFGLKISSASGLNKELLLEPLADEFLKASLDFSPPKIPTRAELCNRGSHAGASYSKKWGGYPKFKELAMSYLLTSSKVKNTNLNKLFRAELEKLKGKKEVVSEITIRPHEHGRMLGFRAFAHVPTYEQDVVGMFSAIAHEIGFEIISNRNAFPDCEANRKVEGSARNRYKKCLIEFEFRSSDFKTHKHPVNGCDLIVCWEHDWKDCPLEVLELKKTIQPLSGWREK